MHQGPSTAAASVSVSAGQAIQVTVGTDVTGALGYNLFVASVQAGPYYYAGRTGYNVGYIKSQPSSRTYHYAQGLRMRPHCPSITTGSMTQPRGLGWYTSTVERTVQHDESRR